MAHLPWHLGTVPATADVAIDRVLADWVKSQQDPFNFGMYAKKARSTAVCAVGLVALRHLIVPLFQAQPAGRYTSTQLQCRIDVLLENSGTLNTSEFPNKFMAKWASVQICVMLAHVRRVQNSTKRYQEAFETI